MGVCSLVAAVSLVHLVLCHLMRTGGREGSRERLREGGREGEVGRGREEERERDGGTCTCNPTHSKSQSATWKNMYIAP